MTFFADGTIDGCLYEVPGVSDLGFEGRRVSGDGVVAEAYRR
jgi:hypothetical protein